MSEYTKSLEKIFFLNDKNVISSLNDTTVSLNPVTSQKVTQNVYSKLNGQDEFLSGEIKQLCVDLSTELQNLNYGDDAAQDHYFVTKVTQTRGKIEVTHSHPTSADIDQLENYVTHEIKLSNDALSTEVSSQMLKSATDLSNFINQKMSIVYRPMGSMKTYADLSTYSEGFSDKTKHIGEVWNVIGSSLKNPEISGQNYVWVYQPTAEHPELCIYGWDEIGGIVDFSRFYTKVESDQVFLKTDGSNSTNHLSVENGLTSRSGFFEEINENLGEYTRLSVGSQGFTLNIDGNRSVDISCPNGYNGIFVNGESVSSFVEAHGGGGSTGVQKIVAGENITISPASGTGVVTISSTGGQIKGNYFDLDKDNTVSTETTFTDDVIADFKFIKDGKSRALSDVVSVENTFESMYNAIANIKSECKLDYIDFNLASQLSVAFDSINKIAEDEQIDVPIVPLDVLNANITEGFLALSSIILSAKYNAYGMSLDETFKKIDDRFDTMEKSLALMNRRLSAFEEIFKTYAIVIK